MKNNSKIQDTEIFTPKIEDDEVIAYFSMEIELESDMPTYSGGLGVLAGDLVCSAADFGVPIVGVTILARKGYFNQKLDENGHQTEEPEEWEVKDFLEEMSPRVSVTIEERTVYIRAWKYEVSGIDDYKIPVYFLDTDISENSGWDRKLTHFLYGGDEHYRLCQEVVLGIGGVRILNALGYENIKRFHMNEGHASLLTVELLKEEKDEEEIDEEDLEAVRRKCVFTTHTPVPAGHDKFSMDLVEKVLGHLDFIFDMKDILCHEGQLNMTYLALKLSHYINGVSKEHEEVSRHLWAPYIIDHITNGIHLDNWVTEPFRELFDNYFNSWRKNNFSLRYALNIPKKEIWNAHLKMKEKLINYVNQETDTEMDVDSLTLGFARRATEYKRLELLFYDIERLKNISSETGSFQVIYAGKAHPKDEGGKKLIEEIFQAKEKLKDYIKVVYLENYDVELAKMLVAGVDVWLNTPKPPKEASGTSGMKAALNAVPSLSILDGWWIEGHIENITGWSIGKDRRRSDEKEEPPDDASDAESLYNKLEKIIIPMFYKNRDNFIDIMRHALALNSSFFNSQRMILQYVLKAYFR